MSTALICAFVVLFILKLTEVCVLTWWVVFTPVLIHVSIMFMFFVGVCICGTAVAKFGEKHKDKF